MCPGKIQPNAVTGPWDRDLETDMNAVAEAGATALVTLMEEHELGLCELSIDALRKAATTRDIAWHHAPIVDFTVPDADWEQTWQTLGQDLRNRLEDGQTIALHCRGGRGRAGMVAARLLVETGTPPEDAIRMVRTERAEAVETDVQERHVLACRVITVT